MKQSILITLASLAFVIAPIQGDEPESAVKNRKPEIVELVARTFDYSSLNYETFIQVKQPKNSEVAKEWEIYLRINMKDITVSTLQDLLVPPIDDKKQDELHKREIGFELIHPGAIRIKKLSFKQFYSALEEISQKNFEPCVAFYYMNKYARLTLYLNQENQYIWGRKLDPNENKETHSIKDLLLALEYWPDFPTKETVAPVVAV